MMGKEKIIKDIKKLKETISEINDLIPTSETLPETDKFLKKWKEHEKKGNNSFIINNKQPIKPKIEIKFLNKSSNVDPDYFHEGDSGFDFRASINSPIILKPLERKLIPTGLYFEVPRGYELQVRPRSGLALKNGVTVLNTPGTVDSNYRGEIKIILINLSDENFIIENGDRVAQGVVSPVLDKVWGELNKVSALNTSNREKGGFGSTGIK